MDEKVSSHQHHRHRHRRVPFLLPRDLLHPFNIPSMKHTVCTIGFAIIVTITAAYKPTFHTNPKCFSSPSTAGSCGQRRLDGNPYFRNVLYPLHNLPRKRRSFGLGMGGYNSYYVESDSDAGSDNFREEIRGRKIDRSKTHMIFGVRCVETTHDITVPTVSEETKVVGLQPLKDLDDESSSDGIICTDDIDEGKTLSILLGHLLSECQSKIDDDFELMEVGADPIVSIAASKLLSGGRVVVCHPDEQRLRVLEHANMFFNERPKDNKCDFQTTALPTDSSFVWLTESPNCDRVILFTSPSLVASRLEEAIAGVAKSEHPPCRVLVPSVIVPPQQLEQYEYQVAAGDSESDGPILLDILSLK